MRALINKVKKHAVNAPGWKTKKKILVFESDDWGSIRMSGKESNERLQKGGIDIQSNNFWRYDALESKSDLVAMFDLLNSFQDKNGVKAKFTPISVVANPDFDAIEKSGFSKYSYQNLQESYERVHNDNSILSFWQLEGIDKGIFVPQFHGREHLNPVRWLKVLKKNTERELLGFNERVLLGGATYPYLKGSKGYLSAFEWSDDEEKRFVLEMIKDGTDLFEKTFGFRSVSFASSNGIQNQESNQTLLDCGVKFHQLGQFFVPQSDGALKMQNKLWGSKNEVGQIYWRRNARFEPSKNPNQNWVNSCFEEIKTAFLWNKPAVVSTHRVNFVGSLSEENRTKNLELLGELIQKVKKRYPQVEFMNSIELSSLLPS